MAPKLMPQSTPTSRHIFYTKENYNNKKSLKKTAKFTDIPDCKESLFSLNRSHLKPLVKT